MLPKRRKVLLFMSFTRLPYNNSNWDAKIHNIHQPPKLTDLSKLKNLMKPDRKLTNVRMHLPGLGQVGDAGVRAHQHVGRVKDALHEPPFRLAQVDPAQRRLRQVVVRHEAEAVEANLVDGVHGLEDAGHPLEAL